MAAEWLVVGAAGLGVMAAAGAWWVLKQPARRLERRRRDALLAAATAAPPSPADAALDPCAPGLNDSQRVQAMRALLQRGDRKAGALSNESRSTREEIQTTSPMAWNPTLPPDEADLVDQQRGKGRSRQHHEDHQHITV